MSIQIQDRFLKEISNRKDVKILRILFLFLILCSCYSCLSIIFPDKKIPEDTIIEIKFPELSLQLKHSFVCSEPGQNKDTVFIYPYYGETIEGHKLSVLSTDLKNMVVFMRYETSAFILEDCQCDTSVALREGCRCELTDWKHYYSDWKKLDINNNGQLVCTKYTEAERQIFPAIPIEELKQRVKEHCGKECYELISKIKSPTEYPCGVSISRYFLSISGQRKDNGKTITKMIIVGPPVNENYVLPN
jgi:hypothetical protein